MKNNNKSYFTTRSFSFCIAIQFVTNKQYYKFSKNNELVYSFEIDENEKDNFYKKLKELENIKFS
jgi:hypothetical protein